MNGIKKAWGHAVGQPPTDVNFRGIGSGGLVPSHYSSKPDNWHNATGGDAIEDTVCRHHGPHLWPGQWLDEHGLTLGNMLGEVPVVGGLTAWLCFRRITLTINKQEVQGGGPDPMRGHWESLLQANYTCSTHTTSHKNSVTHPHPHTYTYTYSYTYTW